MVDRPNQASVAPGIPPWESCRTGRASGRGPAGDEPPPASARPRRHVDGPADECGRDRRAVERHRCRRRSERAWYRAGAAPGCHRHSGRRGRRRGVVGRAEPPRARLCFCCRASRPVRWGRWLPSRHRRGGAARCRGPRSARRGRSRRRRSDVVAHGSSEVWAVRARRAAGPAGAGRVGGVRPPMSGQVLAPRPWAASRGCGLRVGRVHSWSQQSWQTGSPVMDDSVRSSTGRRRRHVLHV